jgi:hypothetical protein
MSRLGRITYGRTSDLIDIPRPDYAEAMEKEQQFDELSKKSDKGAALGKPAM